MEDKADHRDWRLIRATRLSSVSSLRSVVKLLVQAHFAAHFSQRRLGRTTARKIIQAGRVTGLNKNGECRNAECLDCQATRLRRIRSVLAPNGSSINTPETIVVGSGTAVTVKFP